MKKIMDFRKGESGQVLVFVVLTLFLAVLVIPPLLGFGFAAHRTAQIREDRMLKLYAADAGIEDAYFRLIMGSSSEDWGGNFTYPLPQTINGCNVTVTVGLNAYTGKYEVISTATPIVPGGSLGGAPLTVVSHMGLFDYSWYFDNAITSWGDVWIASQAITDGNVSLNGDIEPPGNPGEITGTVDYGVPAWPPTQFLKDYYWLQVEYGTMLIGSEKKINAGESVTWGGNYTSSNFTVSGDGNLTLDGTVYVKGDLTIKNNLKLFLGNNTIFVEGKIVTGQGGNPYIEGPGCLVAIGDIVFLPGQANEEFIFLFSGEGTIDLRPSGTFKGSICGQSTVDLQSGTEGVIQWVPYPVNDEGDPDLNFPGILGNLATKIWDYLIPE